MAWRESRSAARRVERGVKIAFRWMLVFGITTIGFAQWRHFGDSSAAQASPPSVNRPFGATGSRSSPMASELVSLHNAVRKRVGVGSVAWSNELAGVAQEWANHLIAIGQFVHSQNANYGENLFEIQGAAATPNMVVKAWADEAPDYNYSANACVGSKMCGHYTQMVWADTKQVGCAMAKSGPREVWVCEYNPPGNWEGKRPY